MALKDLGMTVEQLNDHLTHLKEKHESMVNWYNRAVSLKERADEIARLKGDVDSLKAQITECEQVITETTA
jgi:ubiquinone biosynthesis protein UbiJ